MGPGYRLVVTDLDGTLWGPDCRLSEPHRAAIHSLQQGGIVVLACTARRPRVLRRLFDINALRLPFVASDGAIGYDESGQRFHSAAFDPQALSTTLEALDAAGVWPCALIDDHDSQRGDVVLPATPSSTQEHLDFLAPDVDPTRQTTDLAQCQVLGLAAAGICETVAVAAASAVAAAGTGIARVEPDRRYPGNNLTITPAGVSKASGVAAFATSHGLHGVKTAAVGDGINDIELLAFADLAISVENSPPDLARHAQRTIKPPGEHGWAQLPQLLDDAEFSA